MEHTSLSNVVLTNVRLAEREVEEVRGCQGRSLPDELNKCFMNFKQLAVCPPAVLKDQRFPKKKKKKSRVQADRRNLHIFAFILQHVNLPPSLRSVFTAPESLVLLSPRCLCIGTKFLFFAIFLL